MSLVKPITLKSGQFELIQAGDTIDDILNIQSIATTASPTFTGLTLSGLVAAGIVYTDTGGLLTVNTAKFSVDATNVRLGIRIASPAAILHVIGIGGVMTAIFGEHLTDVTSKITRIGATHYTNAEEPMAVLMLQVTATDNFIQYGGGTAAMNAATRHIWYTGANNTTVTGTERMRMDILGRLLLGTTTSNAHLYIVQPVATSGTPVPIFRTDGALHTTLANTEAKDVNFNLARTVQFAGSVTLATQRAFVIQAPTYSSDTATKTITTAATLAITGAPVAGTSVVITNPYALWVQAGDSYMEGGLTVTGALKLAGFVNGSILFYNNGIAENNTGLFWDSTNKIIKIGSGTAPSSSLSDTAQLWVEDINVIAAKAGFHIRNEMNTDKLILVGARYKTTTGSPSDPYEGMIEINTFDNVARIYAEGAWRQIASWVA